MSVGFDLFLGDWPVVGDDIVLDVACEVATGQTLSCLDEEGEPRMVTLEWTATPTLAVPYGVGDTVELHVRRAAIDARSRGAWTVRAPGGELLAAGNSAYSSHPDDPEFFAPLRFEVDGGNCPVTSVDSCLDLRPFVIDVDDGIGTTRVGAGQSIDTASGHRMQVERAGMYTSFSDPKFCPADGTPVSFKFLIARRLQ